MIFSDWMVPILFSAALLGFYDICKKSSVRDNSVMPVIFFATLSGSIFFMVSTLLWGDFAGSVICPLSWWWMIFAKSGIVGMSWICVYYAMRELPISIVSPVRASSPLWTFIGGMILFNEIPSPVQGIGMALVFGGYYVFSLAGKLEGISFRRHRGIHLIFLGTLLGATSALYDKFLLGQLRIPRDTVQMWFSIDLVIILGVAWLIRSIFYGEKHRFVWRWTIPLTGVLLIAADWCYFYAVSLPDSQISTISVLRRCSCLVTFLVGGMLFKDKNLKSKFIALTLILIGVILIYRAS